MPGVMEEIRKALRAGASAPGLIQQGYAHRTVYQVQKKLRERGELADGDDPQDSGPSMELAQEGCANCASSLELAEASRKEAEDLRQQLGQQSYPSLQEFLQHCQSSECGHADELRAYKQGIISKTLQEVSDEWLLTTAMDRGLIPKRINVTMKR